MLNLQDIEETLWKTADKLLNNLDADEYEHDVLGHVYEYLLGQFA